MAKVKDILINDYKKYWITDTAQGSLITICYGNKDNVMNIDLRWNNRQRDASGRVINDKK